MSSFSKATGVKKGSMPPGESILPATVETKEVTVHPPSVPCVDIDGSTRASVPSSHLIKDVPWHRQMDGISCAAGALETIFDYWGADIDQGEIMNVARTSSSGTWSFDVVRTGHFSELSDAQGSYRPRSGPCCGFSARRLGYAAFSHTSNECWLNDLKALIADDIPVIVLMSYEPMGGGGHYRVVIGYDDAQQLIYLIEPWDQDPNHKTQWTGVIAWSYSDFQSAWSYLEEGAAQPHYGAVIIPWSVDISVTGEPAEDSVLTITAKIRYPCPEPFDSSQFPAQDVVANITLPTALTLVGGSTEVSIGTLKAGKGANVTWKAHCSADPSGKSVSVTTVGTVLGSVPEASWRGQLVSYPAYDYSDIIGGEATITL